MKWIFWTERKKRWLGRKLKEGIHEFVFLGCFMFISVSLTHNPEYFFPSWTPDFPSRKELLEVSGRLSLSSPGKGSANFVIWSGSRRTGIACRFGFGAWSKMACSDSHIPKHLDWGKTIARYHPQWGMIELVVDGYKVPGYTYEYKKYDVERSGKTNAYRVTFLSLVIFFYLLRDIQVYRRKRRFARFSSQQSKMGCENTHGN
jgi:hypothetical protein